jgi:hypothetical protein
MLIAQAAEAGVRISSMTSRSYGARSPEDGIVASLSDIDHLLRAMHHELLSQPIPERLHRLLTDDDEFINLLHPGSTQDGSKN